MNIFEGLTNRWDETEEVISELDSCEWVSLSVSELCQQNLFKLKCKGKKKKG